MSIKYLFDDVTELYSYNALKYSHRHRHPFLIKAISRFILYVIFIESFKLEIFVVLSLFERRSLSLLADSSMHVIIFCVSRQRWNTVTKRDSLTITLWGKCCRYEILRDRWGKISSLYTDCLCFSEHEVVQSHMVHTTQAGRMKLFYVIRYQFFNNIDLR